MEVDGIGEETDGELDVAQAFNAIATERNIQGSDKDRHLLGIGWGDVGGWKVEVPVLDPSKRGRLPAYIGAAFSSTKPRASSTDRRLKTVQWFL